LLPATVAAQTPPATGNVQNLQGAWMVRLGSGNGSKYKFEADPVVVDGVMSIPTGNDDSRGVAVGEGKVFSGQLDGSFVALDQQTGGRGGTEWSPTSYSPQTGFVHVNAGMQDGVLSTVPQSFVLGQRYTGQAGGSAPPAATVAE
jgi:quinohemoprotein ethanol dehydrogenase